MLYQKELEVAERAVRKAVSVCRWVERRLDPSMALEKEDRSPVTLADFASQAVVCRCLQAEFPDDPLVAEESADALRKDKDLGRQVLEVVRTQDPAATLDGVVRAIDYGARDPGGTDRRWVLDPIDGTRGFLRRDQYAVALALLVSNTVVAGVLGCPNYPPPEITGLDPGGYLFYALQGGGTWMCGLDSPEPRRVAGSPPRQLRICESYEPAHSSHAIHLQISQALGITAPPLRIDSQAKYAAVARKDASIYLRFPKREGYREKIWDHAAGWLVVQESGGRVTDVDGKAIDFSFGRQLVANRGIVATSGHRHQAVLDAVKQVITPQRGQPRKMER